MADLGHGVDPDVSVKLEQHLWLGDQWTRWTMDPERVEQQKGYARLMRAFGIQCFLTHDTTSYGRFGDPFDPATQERAINFSAGEFGDLIDLHNPVNEPDGVQFESSTMPVEMVNYILWYSRQTWPEHVDLAAVGGVTGQLAYYNDVELQWVQWLDDHLYNKFAPVENPGPDNSLELAIDQRVQFARDKGLKGFLMSEIGLDSWQVGEDRQAEFVYNTFSYVRDRADVRLCLDFCAHPYQGWGKLAQDGSWKPSADEFRQVQGDPNVPVELPHFVSGLGFEKWHSLEPWLIGDARSNETNVFPDAVQTQRTSEGTLFWIAGHGFMFSDDRGRVHKWQDGWPASQEVE